MPDWQDRSAQTTIVTVCLRGHYQRPVPKTRDRVLILERLVEAFAAYGDWAPVDSVLLPGGFLRISEVVGHRTTLERQSIVENSQIGRALSQISGQLHALWPKVALIVGIDSRPMNRWLGGDQLVSAWRDGNLIALTRKAFPVNCETDGSEPVVWITSGDADDPQRSIILRNGQRAVLLACYDAFALRAVAGAHYADLTAIRFICDQQGRIRPATQAERQEHLERWLAYLARSPPDLGLVAIHSFAKAGRDGYWQRHGIAGASAALQGMAIIGAAHLEQGLPHSLSLSPLAAHGVPQSHLTDGTRRTAHRLAPIDGFTLFTDDHKPPALIRRFVIPHQRNIT